MAKEPAIGQRSTATERDRPRVIINIRFAETLDRFRRLGQVSGTLALRGE
jgi:hypothetical protein